MIPRHRAVVTGIGVLAANGIGIDAFWNSLYAGDSGIDKITLFDTQLFKTKIGGEIKGFDITHYMSDSPKLKKLARHSQYGLVAAQMAIEDAGLKIHELQKNNSLPVILGVSISGLDICEAQIQRLHHNGPRIVSPVVGEIPPQSVANAIHHHLGIGAYSQTISTVCSAGMDAVSMATDLIKSGKSDIVLTGASEAALTPFLLATFSKNKMLSTQNETPQKASKPFDKNRDGGLLADAAGMLIIESFEHAKARGAEMYFEVKSSALVYDQPNDKTATSLQGAMQKAIDNAGYYPSQINHISAHGPSDRTIDKMETDMIKKVMNEHAPCLPVTSIKGATGNPFSAAGILQIIASALCIKNQIILPTINLETKDPECDLDYVSEGPRRATIKKFTDQLSWNWWSKF